MNQIRESWRKTTVNTPLNSLKSAQDAINFRTIHFLLIFSLFSLITACGGKGTNHMTQDQLLASIEKGTAPVIVDVRSESEYESGHVPGALHLPFYALWSRHEEMKAQPEDPVIMYCEHGPRAGIAKFALWTLGYTNLVYLEDHMSGWKEQELPMEKSSEKLR
jgi:rhodanese-related sulfurtransferase